MKLIGITGGIGSGKSTISNHFKKKGYAVHDSDEVVSDLYEKKNKNFLSLLRGFGLKDIIKNNKINKKLIAKNIFSNKKLKTKLEEYIHQEVRLKRNSFIKKNLKLDKDVVFLDIPLLLENNLENEIDIVLSIISTKANRTKRVMKRKNFSRELLYKVYKQQTTDKERRLRSNIIIVNNTTKKDFLFAAERALIDILK